jgi:hypothetical protein
MLQQRHGREESCASIPSAVLRLPCASQIKRRNVSSER